MLMSISLNQRGFIKPNQKLAIQMWIAYIYSRKPKNNTMHKLMIKGLILTCCVLLSFSSFAQEGSWTGEVVDLDCYVANGSLGEGHAQCAKSCITSGKPIGLLTEKGDVILLVAGSKKEVLAGLAGQKAEVKGKKSVRGGITMIVVSEASKVG